MGHPAPSWRDRWCPRGILSMTNTTRRRMRGGGSARGQSQCCFRLDVSVSTAEPVTLARDCHEQGPPLVRRSTVSTNRAPGRPLFTSTCRDRAPAQRTPAGAGRAAVGRASERRVDPHQAARRARREQAPAPPRSQSCATNSRSPTATLASSNSSSVALHGVSDRAESPPTTDATSLIADMSVTPDPQHQAERA